MNELVEWLDQAVTLSKIMTFDCFFFCFWYDAIQFKTVFYQANKRMLSQLSFVKRLLQTVLQFIFSDFHRPIKPQNMSKVKTKQ